MKQLNAQLMAMITNLTESLAEYLVLANNALTESESQQYDGLRKYLDDINTIETKSSTEFEQND